MKNVQKRSALAVGSAAGVLGMMVISGPANADTCSESWLPAVPGPGSHVFALTPHDDGSGPSLFAGGAFTSAGGEQVNYIARWDGEQWHELGGGMYDDVIPWVYALHELGGDLYAGGQFTEAGSAPANRVARWDGEQWLALGDGVDGAVWALETREDRLIVGGFFTTAGGENANRIASWDGAQWAPLGDGMNGAVVALTNYNGDLIAGGQFTTADGVPANYIARWDGEQWHPLGEGLDGHARALLVHDGTLYVGGRFEQAGGEPAGFVATWDGESWSSIGDGLGGGFIPAGVEALALHNGNLIAGGNFTEVEGEPASHFARWNGSQWIAMDQSPNSMIWAMTEWQDVIHIGGYLNEAGGESVPFWARWTIEGAPVITQQPDDLAVAPDGKAILSVEVESDRAATYQWRKNGSPLVDDERISGSQSDTLTIEPVIEGDAGQYDVIITNACGQVLSDAVTLDIGIVGDINGDGVVDSSDLLILLSEWGPCEDPEDCPADLNQDGVVDSSDLLMLLANWG